jgi:hypothetical protein
MIPKCNTLMLMLNLAPYQQSRYQIRTSDYQSCLTAHCNLIMLGVLPIMAYIGVYTRGQQTSNLLGPITMHVNVNAAKCAAHQVILSALTAQCMSCTIIVPPVVCTVALRTITESCILVLP